MPDTGRCYNRKSLSKPLETIGDQALRAPDEMVAITGVDPTALQDLGWMEIWTFDGAPRAPGFRLEGGRLQAAGRL